MAALLTTAVAVFFVLMGIVALAKPEQVVHYFGTATLTLDGRNEVRAVYGGFGVAIAALLATTTRMTDYRAGVLLSVAVALYGMAAGRIASRLFDGAVGFYPKLFFAVEVVLATMLVVALLLA